MKGLPGFKVLLSVVWFRIFKFELDVSPFGHTPTRESQILSTKIPSDPKP